MKPRIYAGFNNSYGKCDRPDAEHRVVLGGLGTNSDLQQQGVQLREGLELTLYMAEYVDPGATRDDLEVDAVVEIDKFGDWVGLFAWGDLKHQSEK